MNLPRMNHYQNFASARAKVIIPLPHILFFPIEGKEDCDASVEEAIRNYLDDVKEDIASIAEEDK